MSDSWENIIGRVIDAQPFAMQNDGRRVWQLFRDDVHVGDAIKAIAALLGNSLRQVPEGLGAEVKSAALGVATIHVDQSYFGPHMIGPGMKIRIFVENPTPPTSGKCRHDFRKGTVANCIHCGECGYADPSTPLATPAQAGAELPELPAPAHTDPLYGRIFTSQQMRAYAELARLGGSDG